MADLIILGPTFGLTPWLSSALELWTTSVSRIPGEIHLLVSSTLHHGDTQLAPFLPGFVQTLAKNMEILLKKDLIKFCDWLGTVSKNKEMKNNCKEYYSMANEKKGIRRASYGSKSVSIADLRDMLSWRW